MTAAVIYTDMDGTLLDHHTYSWAPAETLLSQLQQRGIPVVPCTSKTRAELIPLRAHIGLTGPFIVENGAAVVFPEDSPLAHDIDAESTGDGYRVHAFVEPRSHWLAMIERTYAQTGRVAQGFSEMSIEELVALTGLTPESARQAAAREYGEPLHWLVDEPERAAFLQRIQSAGAVVLQGGRFAHISGQSDKGHALRWLHSLYTGGSPNAPVSIAAGDSHNDVAMLEAADWSLRVRSPVQEPPELQKTWQVVTSEQQGPAGWAQGIADILARLQE